MSNQDNVLAARVGLKWLEEQQKVAGNRTRIHRLFQQICEQVIAAAGAKTSFVIKDILESEHESESGSQVRKKFKELGEWLSERADVLAESAVDNNFKVYPTGQVTKGDRVLVFTFSARDIDLRFTPSKNDIPEGAIRYTFETRRELNMWLRWLYGAQLGLIPAILMVVLLFGFAGFMILLIIGSLYSAVYQPSIYNWLLTTLLIIVSAKFYKHWRRFYELPERRVVLMPDLLAGRLTPTALVLHHQDDERLPRLNVIAATAKCPVCGGTIVLRADKDNRVYGACTVNPNEHTFSFDYTKKLGRRRN
ncbi:hypothetical protein [Pseudidiomarina sp.]|uniref:hypothetical protein n=1 Tax=Pseudidiomarina sp. TaxID=2081707 RepID=UPI003A97D15C